MKEQELVIFIECVRDYFETFDSKDSIAFRPPIILSGERAKTLKEYVLDYTGTIAISGDFSGAIYVSTNETMLDKLIEVILGVDECSHEDRVDMAGEIVNTISGNARKTLGSNLNISVPFVVSGNTVSIDLPRLISPIYVLPCQWRGENFYVFIGLDLSVR
ncbi:MAG: hypothetical protein KU37_09875 [Sulfuricurvum sp. PC08-66]|nr:MAG: hypothetical protein KU37_09875 [Sulfuricurvum sp. PC08-66]